jgi:hypothetical protein
LDKWESFLRVSKLERANKHPLGSPGEPKKLEEARKRMDKDARSYAEAR